MTRLPRFIVQKILLLTLFLPCGIHSQQKKIFHLNSDNSHTGTYSPKPLANTVSVIEIAGDTVYTANSAGLSITTDRGQSWYNLTSQDGYYKGSITAMAYATPYLFLTTLYDTNLSVKPTYGPGGGISYTKDFGRTWTHIAQPTDTARQYDYIIRPNGDTIYAIAVRTNIDNVTWDIALTDSSIWIASFAGGLRHAPRYADGSIGYFRLAPIPPDNLYEVRPDSFYHFIIHPFNNLNHRVFSVLATSIGIFSGTAGGINHTTDGGLSWKRSAAQNSGLSGNFIVALGEQIFTENNITRHYIWAAANRALGQNEYNGLCFSPDSGKTWRVTLQGPFINNIAFDGKTVYAATDEGMYRSDDLGQNWTRYLNIIDNASGDRFFSMNYYTVGVQQPGPNRVLYFANQDGLAISENNGLTWRIPRVFPQPGKNRQPVSYAYPNPFSPSAEPNVTRFAFDQTGLQSTDRVTITIYDFAMDPVAVIAKNQPLNQTFFWDGRNAKGQRVANGTYIYIIEAGGKKFHGRVTVRN